jgi:hypothetical protein
MRWKIRERQGAALALLLFSGGLLVGCQRYANSPPVEPCGGCPAGERCCLDEEVCWPAGERCPCEGVVCLEPPALVCADGFTLRVHDEQGVCELGRCTYPFEDFVCEVGPCRDGACTGGCPQGACLADADCDDGNMCTAEACWAGCCHRSPHPEGTACDDLDPCTAGDVCRAGACRGQPVPGCRPCREDADCDDGNPCTWDACLEGGCSSTPAGDGMGCDDGEPCTFDDRCQAAVCTGRPDPDCFGCEMDPGLCDDGNPCTLDLCENRRCAHEPLDGPACDDGHPCSLSSACVQGACRGLDWLPDCHRCDLPYYQCWDWARACQISACVEGICQFWPAPDGSACEEDWGCIANQRCLDGQCVGDPIEPGPALWPSYALATDCPGLADASGIRVTQDIPCWAQFRGAPYELSAPDPYGCLVRTVMGGGLVLDCRSVSGSCSVQPGYDPRSFVAQCAGCELRFALDQGCYRNADCPAGQSCQVFLSAEPGAGLEQACASGGPPGYDNTGAACANDAQCFSLWCLSPQGVCTGLCVTGADCPAGSSCRDESLEIAPGRYDILRRCLP